ncbi:MAG: DUF423 domain-containing protein [Bdellovibrionota bacterium]
MGRRWISMGAYLLAAAVMAGAFGAHGLKQRLAPEEMAIYEKAVWYHFVHAAAVCFVGLLGETNVLAQRRTSGLAAVFLAGIAFFSGSLYALALSGVKVLGAITPIGGVLFIVGWLSLGRTVGKESSR